MGSLKINSSIALTFIVVCGVFMVLGAFALSGTLVIAGLLGVFGGVLGLILLAIPRMIKLLNWFGWNVIPNR